MAFDLPPANWFPAKIGWELFGGPGCFALIVTGQATTFDAARAAAEVALAAMLRGTCWLLVAVMRVSLRSQRPSSCICVRLPIAAFEAAPELHDGMVAVELNDGRSVVALTGSDPEAVWRHVAQEPASS